MPLGLVLIQQLPDLTIQRPVDPRQAFCEILVYGGFADAEFRRRGPDGRPVIYDVNGQVTGPFLDTATHTNHSPCAAFPRVDCFIYMSGVGAI